MAVLYLYLGLYLSLEVERTLGKNNNKIRPNRDLALFLKTSYSKDKMPDFLLLVFGTSCWLSFCLSNSL
jgi:hypothetical protein